MSNGDEQVAAVERAIVTIRRSQNRRSLARIAASRATARAPGLAAAPVRNSSFDVLDVIEAAEQAGVPATVSTVAAALHVDQPRSSKLVTAAVEAGLVRREADQADGRRAPLVRTQAGRALTDEVHRFRRFIFAAAMADWPDADRAEFARLLTRFVEALSTLPRLAG